MRMKVSYNASEGLKDKMPLDHPTLGEIPVYLVYERAARLCPYYGTIGHDLAGCPKRIRVLQLCSDPAYAHCTDLLVLRNHRKGPWMNCPALVPRPLPDDAPHDFPSYSQPATANTHPTTPLHQHNPPQQLFDPPHQLSNSTTNPAPPHANNSADPGAMQPQPEPTLPITDFDPVSNPNQASPLHLAGPSRYRLHNGPTTSANTSLTNRAQNLSLYEDEAREASPSPPPGYYKRLRAASPQSSLRCQ